MIGTSRTDPAFRRVCDTTISMALSRKKKPRDRPLLGAHMSIAGGVHNALHAGDSVGCEAIQIFTKSFAAVGVEALERGRRPDIQGHAEGQRDPHGGWPTIPTC